MPLAELALRFIVSHPAITVAIPGMRREQNVIKNLANSGNPLNQELLNELKKHRWDRAPTSWSC